MHLLTNNTRCEFKLFPPSGFLSPQTPPPPPKTPKSKVTFSAAAGKRSLEVGGLAEGREEGDAYQHLEVLASSLGRHIPLHKREHVGLMTC